MRAIFLALPIALALAACGADKAEAPAPGNSAGGSGDCVVSPDEGHVHEANQVNDGSSRC